MAVKAGNETAGPSTPLRLDSGMTILLDDSQRFVTTTLNRTSGERSGGIYGRS